MPFSKIFINIAISEVIGIFQSRQIALLNTFFCSFEIGLLWENGLVHCKDLSLVLV